MLLFIPFPGNAQQPGDKYSPSNYMWKDVGNAGFSAGQMEAPSLAFSSSGELYVAYCDVANSYKATVMKFDGTEWAPVGMVGFSTGTGGHPSLAFSPLDHLPYVAFREHLDNSFKLTVMKFNGTGWIQVGSNGFIIGGGYFPSLIFNPSGVPYVAFLDSSSSYKVTVIKYENDNWMSLGAPGFSAGGADFINLAYNPVFNAPYVVYEDFGNSNKATVMRFDGIEWVTAGNAGFSDGEAWCTSIAISPLGEIYVAYEDVAIGSRAIVKKFYGTNWETVGSLVSESSTCYESIAFDFSGEPNVAYADISYFYRATVKKYDGVNWINVGVPGFSLEEAIGTNLVFSPSGEPYVGYSDSELSYKATVMKYDSVFVGINDRQDGGVFLYPNPTSKTITIDLRSFPGNLDFIEINDMKGIRMFENQPCKRKIVLNVENYPSGIYLVRVKTESSIWTGKFCKD